MVREALTNYLSLASGLTEVTKKRARSAAKALAAQGEAKVGQVGGLAEEILETSRANRSALVNLIRYEVDRALGRVGLVTAEELATVQRRIAELEKALRERTSGSVTGSTAGTVIGSAAASPPAEPASPSAAPPEALAAAASEAPVKVAKAPARSAKAAAKTAADPAGPPVKAAGTVARPPAKAAKVRAPVGARASKATKSAPADAPAKATRARRAKATTPPAGGSAGTP